jgi:hypothetical protein
VRDRAQALMASAPAALGPVRINPKIRGPHVPRGPLRVRPPLGPGRARPACGAFGCWLSAETKTRRSVQTLAVRVGPRVTRAFKLDSV